LADLNQAEARLRTQPVARAPQGDVLEALAELGLEDRVLLALRVHRLLPGEGPRAAFG
jgi:hypothetical protein